jgi:hypothetical protein
MTTVAEQWLAELVKGADPALLNRFIREINKQKDHTKKEHDPNKQNGPVKTYTTVVKRYNCLICGANFTTRHRLGKGEQLSTIDDKGNVHTVTVTGKEGEVEIKCTISKCEFCCKLVSHWTRDELELAFMTLVSCMTFHEKACYNAIMKEERDMTSLQFHNAPKVRREATNDADKG